MATSEEHLARAVDEALDPAWPHERRRALRRWSIARRWPSGVVGVRLRPAPHGRVDHALDLLRARGRHDDRGRLPPRGGAGTPPPRVALDPTFGRRLLRQVAGCRIVGAWNLGRRVTVAMATLATVGAGCSTPQGLTTPPLPSGWKTVTYHGVGVDVPGNWTVEPWHQNCGVSVPTVFVGPGQASVLSCPVFDPGGAEVVLGALRFTGTTAQSTTQTINGLAAKVISQQMDAPCGQHSALVSSAWVTLPTKGFTISISVSDSPICPGGDPESAAQIQGSIHAV